MHDDHNALELAEALGDPLVLALMVRFSPNLELAEKALRLAKERGRAEARCQIARD